MKIDAIIFGASGYGGGELLFWLTRHPNVVTVRGTSRSRAGRPFHDAHPNLRNIVDGTFEPEIAWKGAANSEQLVIFSALPHGALAETLPQLESDWSQAGITHNLLLIDLSADFRASKDFVYGLPEWNFNAIGTARRIASPGCFATALQLGLLPMRDTDAGFIAATAVTGSSGSGASASATTHHPTRAGDFRAYKVFTHQHCAEVAMAMKANNIGGRLAFVPQSGPFVRGIFATLQFPLSPNATIDDLRDRAAKCFRNSPFIRIVEESPHVAAVTGTNFADIAIAGEDGSAAIMVAIDNLGKGMAGQAVQSMNIALGVPETAGLWTPGRFPA